MPVYPRAVEMEGDSRYAGIGLPPPFLWPTSRHHLPSARCGRQDIAYAVVLPRATRFPVHEPYRECRYTTRRICLPKQRLSVRALGRLAKTTLAQFHFRQRLSFWLAHPIALRVHGEMPE